MKEDLKRRGCCGIWDVIHPIARFFASDHISRIGGVFLGNLYSGMWSGHSGGFWNNGHV